MDNLVADFIINYNEPLEAEFELRDSYTFDCSFELFAAGTVWGSIDGTLSNQTDLQNELNGLSDGIIANHDEIGRLEQLIGTYGDIVTYDASDFATSAQGALADTALQPNDNISELNNNVGYITSASIPTNYVTTDTVQSISSAKNFTQINNANGNNLAAYNTIQSTNDIGNTSENLRLQGNGDRPRYRSGSNVTSFLALQTDIPTMTAGTGIDITSDTISVTDPTLVNNGTGTKALAVGKTSQSTAEGGVAVGYGAQANSTYGTAVGYESRASNTNTTVIGKGAKATQARAIAIGSGAEATAQDAIAIKGINNTANTFQVYSYNMLDMSTGLIPDARISANIARTSAIPSVDQTYDGTSSNPQSGTAVASAVSGEATLRQNADNGLQSQIDAIVSSSDVFDIVGTYAELQAYDITTVPVNDIIKVLVDETHSGAATYYRCVETGGVKGWSYIGSEGAYYTKGEADNKFVPQIRTVNSKALSSDITLTASDVGALPDSTVIPTVNDGTLTIQVNGTSVGTFTANQSGNTTANIVVPDSATWGNITGDIADQTDLQDALGDKQDVLSGGRYIEIVSGGTIATLPEGCKQVEYITATGTQHLDTLITATNDYEIRAKFRLTELNDSFLYGARQAYGSSSFALHKNYAPFSTDVGTGYVNLGVDSWYNVKQNKNGIYINDLLAHSYNNSLASFTTPNTIRVFAMAQGDNALYGSTFMKGDFASFEIYNNGVLVCNLVPCIDSNDVACMYDTVNERFLYNLGTGNFTAGAEVVPSDTINCTLDGSDINTLLGYTPVNPSSLATVATSGDYDDLTNKPTIPTVGDGTITITQGGVTKGTFTTNQSGNSTIALDAGGGGGSYSAGTGIDITNDTISIDTSVVAQLSDIPTNYVTTDTAQNISGRKTFLGEKAIYFKQSATTNKLGFTLYNPSDTELGAFEWRPNTISSGALLNINVPYSSSNYVGFRYWGTGVNIIAPKVATAGNYYIPTHITDGNTTVTANSNGTVNISSLLPNVSGYLENTATGTDSLTILGTPATDGSSLNIGYGSATSYDGCIAIGSEDSSVPVNGAISADMSVAIGSGYDVHNGAYADGVSVAVGTGSEAISGSVAVGYEAKASSGNNTAIGVSSIANGDWGCVAIGDNAEATAVSAIQIGSGTNNVASTLQIGNKQLLSLTTGLIPDARLSSNIARTSQIPTVPTNISSFTNDSGYITSASLPTMTYTSATETLTFG